mmetsp:Transcript_3597/g.7604  ORF Transcript_3597/g.7604 Transcript_3597/m.7604 type:complete len:247 (+) Transcript_3597:702-1442(+)
MDPRVPPARAAEHAEQEGGEAGEDRPLPPHALPELGDLQDALVQGGPAQGHVERRPDRLPPVRVRPPLSDVLQEAPRPHRWHGPRHLRRPHPRRGQQRQEGYRHQHPRGRRHPPAQEAPQALLDGREVGGDQGAVRRQGHHDGHRQAGEPQGRPPQDPRPREVPRQEARVARQARPRPDGHQRFREGGGLREHQVRARQARGEGQHQVPRHHPVPGVDRGGHEAGPAHRPAQGRGHRHHHVPPRRP